MLKETNLPCRPKSAAALAVVGCAVIEKFLSGDPVSIKIPWASATGVLGFVKTDSPLALFSVVAISQPYLTVEPKSIHGSLTEYHLAGWQRKD